jgi:hypothetical protein
MKKILLMCIPALVAVSIPWFSLAQTSAPNFPKAAFINAKINAAGDLEITPSNSSSQHDFDFLTGKWRMVNKRLKSRFTNSTAWEEFESMDENYGSMLQGVGNMDLYKATFDGKLFEGLTLRLFNPKTKLWSLYWIPSSTGVMDPPVVGSFEGSVGSFYCKDVYQGKPVIVMFRWDKTNVDKPVWSQAFSPDNGATWEWNWTNTSYRTK